MVEEGEDKVVEEEKEEEIVFCLSAAFWFTYFK